MTEKNLSVLSNVQERENVLLKNVYGYMSIGLILTALFSYLISQSASAIRFIYSNPFVTLACVVAELALVFFLSARLELVLHYPQFF